MESKEENERKPAKKYQKVKKVGPLGDTKNDPPTRDEKPQEEFIDTEANPSNGRS
ncbi:hypothetical protein GCM10009119_38090 [Algoriphagus jejuensis]|uniref:Uncharacterized protein n=1 Tax=Algoriphagus jejuensis TaxID=419934 RepID=A0ABP3YJW3_9BACT